MRPFLSIPPTLLFLISGLLLLSGCEENRSLPTSAEELMAEIRSTSDELVEVLKSVRDSESAKAAEEKLIALREKLSALYQQARELDFGEEQWRELREATSKLADQARDQLQNVRQSPELRRAMEQLNRLVLGDEAAGDADAPESPR